MPIKLIAPPHTPLTSRGDLNLDVVTAQSKHFATSGISGVFVAGSTGEGPSLAVEERMNLAARWVEVAGPLGLDVIVQVGSNCQSDAVRLASHAAETGAQAIAAMAPCYFKPTTAEQLVAFFEPIAGAASTLPFYFYDIPAMTGVSISTLRLLQLADQRLPNIAGLKYSNSDLIQFQECVRHQQGRYEMWFGNDESLLAGYALGARGAVGSSYNFAAPLYHKMIAAYDSGDEDLARNLQAKSVAMVRACEKYGYAASAKCVMSWLGIDCGPVRSPLQNLTLEQIADLRQTFSTLDVLDQQDWSFNVSP